MKLLSAFFAGTSLFAVSAFAGTLSTAVTVVVVDPTTPSTLYAGDNSTGNTYKSTDGGVTWTPMLVMPIVDSIAPVRKTDVLYESGASATSGADLIFRSTDGGLTWSEKDAGITQTVDRMGPLATDPLNDEVVYAASYAGGLFKSSDLGENWTSIDGGIEQLTSEAYSPVQLIVDPAHSGTVYFSLAASGSHGSHGGTPPPVPSGIYKSTDGGATWHATGIAGLMAMDPADSSHLAACSGGKLKTSHDGGATWSDGAACSGSLIAISSIDPNRILLASESSTIVQLSDDGGATLRDLYTFPTQIRSIATNAESIYVGTQGSGLYISRDYGLTWSPSSGAPRAPIHVPADRATIQLAIAAATNGDTVLVAPGTYHEKLDFEGKAITVKSSGGAAVTILDGDNGGPIVSFQWHETNASVLQGFTLTHARQTDVIGHGPAIYMNQSSPTIEDDVFVDNADLSQQGAAIAGGKASPVIIRNYFTGNTRYVDSGYPASSYCAVIFDNDSSPLVADNVFVGNSTAAYCQSFTSAAVPRIYNNTIVGNVAGLMLSVFGGTAGRIVSNNLIAFNGIGIGATLLNGASMPPFTGNLVYGNTGADYQGIADQTGTAGNLSADPSLADWQDGDVRPLTGSPVIDTGDAAVSQFSESDFYGVDRFHDGTDAGSAAVDIGAAEYYASGVSAEGGQITADAGTPATGQLQWTASGSPDGLVPALVAQGIHGTVIFIDPAAGTFKYVPALGYVGTDSFSFEIKDASGFVVSNVATEQVSIAEVAPAAGDGGVGTHPGIAVSGAVAATAAYEGQTLGFGAVSQPAHGRLTFDTGTGQFTYTPDASFQGVDSFTFKATDQYGTDSNTATEQLTVTDVVPTTSDAGFSTVADVAVSGAIPATAGYTGQRLSYSVVTPPVHGKVTLGGGHFTYTPATGFAGADSFTFEVTDSVGAVSNVSTVSITVSDVAPKATGGLVRARRNTPLKGVLRATTAYSGQVLQFQIVSGAAHGTVIITDAAKGAYTYTPAAGYRGKDNFTFRVVDQWGTPSNTAPMNIDVF